MNIELELAGYKCRATHILTRPKLLPFYPHDEMMVIVEFEEPYPVAIISTGIRLPAKKYTQEEFIKVFKAEGEKQILASIARHMDSQVEMKSRNERDEELKTMAKGVESFFP